ncbi:MAG: DUF924 family protein [Calothrix sp. MO_192.B10]|nr:DUF924 family protein [Calothrix sp. MO_192.B10]
MKAIDTILNFWFGGKDEVGYGKRRLIWFAKDPEFDRKIQTYFQADYEEAKAGQLDHWKESADGCLALIILLDQFPRNMFRGTPQAFATDSQALSIAEYGITKGFDRELLMVQRWFIYLPFQHSEDLQRQYQSVELFRRLGNHPDNQDAIDYAIRHLEIIQRFGRFPHRNDILGRATTPEEAEFLQHPGSSF